MTFVAGQRRAYAGMAELADAHGSGPCDSNVMRVRVSFPAGIRREYQAVFPFL